MIFQSFQINARITWYLKKAHIYFLHNLSESPNIFCYITCLVKKMSLNELRNKQPSDTEVLSTYTTHTLRTFCQSVWEVNDTTVLHKVSFHTYMLHEHPATQYFQQVLTYNISILLQSFKNARYKHNSLGNGNCSRKNHTSRTCISASVKFQLQIFSFIMKGT